MEYVKELEIRLTSILPENIQPIKPYIGISRTMDSDTDVDPLKRAKSARLSITGDPNRRICVWTDDEKLSESEEQENLPELEEQENLPGSTVKSSELAFIAINLLGKGNNLEYKVDEVGNVAMFRPAAPGFENAKGVVLQGHMDMVAEKLPSSNHNFLTDPIQTRIVDDWVFATDTTLGADDGLGLAIALAALTDPDIKCGALEALATVDEETGLTGATNIKADMLVGDYLLNLDSEDDGVITIGCAGGVVTPVWFDYKPEAAPADLQYFAIKIGKLMGGHSGTDINKGLASATKQLARILYMLDAKIEYRLAVRPVSSSTVARASVWL